jgi:hypothetical protein
MVVSARDALPHCNFSLAEELRKTLFIGCSKKLGVYNLIEIKNQETAA